MPEAVVDLDKCHRIGPKDGNKQSVIVRFKSHSSRYNVYEKRKDCPRGIKLLNPSLTKRRKDLLESVQNDIDKMDSYCMENPFEFAFANKHGDIQVKLRKRLKNKMFIEIMDYEDYQIL